jgi:hypothetical protein
MYQEPRKPQNIYEQTQLHLAKQNSELSGLALRSKLAALLDKEPLEQRQLEWDQHMFVLQKKLRRTSIFNVYILNRVSRSYLTFKRLQWKFNIGF